MLELLVWGFPRLDIIVLLDHDNDPFFPAFRVWGVSYAENVMR